VQPGKVFSYPNPYKPGSAPELTFRFEPSASASIELYDIAGRRLFELPAHRVQAAQGLASWDGRLNGGPGLPAGLYFIILKRAEGTVTGKLSLR
jgi:hypothetical protein